MAKVVALQTWSNGTITMDEKSVQDIPDALASTLIAQGICADASSYFGGGSGGGVLVVTDTNGNLDKTWQEIHDADAAIISLSNNADSKLWYIVTGVRERGDNFLVDACRPTIDGKTGEPQNDLRRYTASSADGYPVAE